ncbi:hypothetical protein [Kribbella shirazensis]|jgi:hypothetical protein|uniref:Uncharacterized protein n=1 Tax=Kribbella shirazensis TaxID=1105143 RepID=A0A7X5V494_9ACTN|nr:hypothetical protein [Kribbella shirazensis]NIK54300.1 hypothetical protein [Kribbella shirazensis]
MALIELTADDLCAMVSSPFPCEEGTIIDPVAVAHFLGLVETGASESGNATADTGFAVDRKADPRLAVVSLACSMEASQAVTRARSETGADRVAVQQSLDEFVDGVIASPPVLSTVIPPPGTVVVIGTVIVTIPTPPPVPPHWEAGEQLARTDLLALAVRFHSASKMPGIGQTADDLATAATRLIEAAIIR